MGVCWEQCEDSVIAGVRCGVSFKIWVGLGLGLACARGMNRGLGLR